MENQERENPTTRAYTALDDVLMKGAEAVVKSYNWTTGRTKADLANKLLTVAPILESAGVFGVGSFYILPLCGAFLLASHFQQRMNKKTELAEKKSMSDGAVDYEIVMAYDLNSQYGKMIAISSLLQASISLLSKHPEDSLMIAAGQAVRSGSHYVMRTDFLPPRKNCLSRGLERLAELADEYAPQIFPKPELNLVPELAR
ncbi:hypothetical protein J4462_01745 [Candidatus Pacearchaeota archaeon]|nr:hypothetical protein [Candidatus Pacearchaeota archaeon]